MSQVFVPLITASGTIFAAVLTGFGAATLKHRWDVQDQERAWNRERGERFSEDKKATYVQFMVSLDSFIKLQFSGRGASYGDQVVTLIDALTANIMTMRLIAPAGLAELAFACMKAALVDGRLRTEELEGKFQYAAREDLAGRSVDYESLDGAALRGRTRMVAQQSQPTVTTPN